MAHDAPLITSIHVRPVLITEWLAGIPKGPKVHMSVRIHDFQKNIQANCSFIVPMSFYEKLHTYGCSKKHVFAVGGKLTSSKGEYIYIYIWHDPQDVAFIDQNKQIDFSWPPKAID
eukprot:8971843-Karenia_brevis.AAC.1